MKKIKKQRSKYKYIKEDFIELAILKHGDKYDYSKFVYVINKKGTNRTNSKFAIRIPDSGKPEVWDQQDNRSSFDFLYESMPGIDEILSTILNIGGTDYQALVNYKKGNYDTTFNITSNEEVFDIVDGNVILFFNDDSYFKLFKHQLYSYTIEQLETFTKFKLEQMILYLYYYSFIPPLKFTFIL